MLRSTDRVEAGRAPKASPARSLAARLVAVCAGALSAAMACAASLEFFVNDQEDYDVGRQIAIPSGFGAGEFTLELWIRPNDSFPVGSTSGGPGQRQNWSDADNAPYSSGSWWFAGNFLLDGHNNSNSNFRLGTFSLQFYGGGRVRWLFGDGTDPGPGDVWSVGAFPATDAPDLLDGNWHQLTLVRRWVGTTDAQLELWVDGQIVDAEIAGGRVNMRQWWDNWSGFPANETGWYWGAEKQAANGTFNQYEDFKGLIDELRFWSRAKDPAEIQANYDVPVNGNEPGLVGWYAFNQLQGLSTCNALTSAQCIQLTETSLQPDPMMWSAVNAPLFGSVDMQPPTKPLGLQGTAVSPSRIDLGWNASVDNVGVTGYRVRRNGALAATVMGTSHSDTGLAAGTAYSYTVAAFDAAGNESPPSDPLVVTTPGMPDTQAPTVPSGLQGAAVSSSRIDLGWNAATDNVGVTGYRVRRNGAVVGTPATTSFSDTGLVASTQYTYTISAIDAAGNESGLSGAVQVTTQSAAPPPGGGGGGGGAGSWLEALALLLLIPGARRRPARA